MSEYDAARLSKSRQDLVDSAEWLTRRMGLRKARDYTRARALSNNTMRGRDWWFALAEMVGAKCPEWRRDASR